MRKPFEEQQTDSVCVRITEPDTVAKGGNSTCSGWKLSGSALQIGTMATSQMQIHILDILKALLSQNGILYSSFIFLLYMSEYHYNLVGSVAKVEAFSWSSCVLNTATDS